MKQHLANVDAPERRSEHAGARMVAPSYFVSEQQRMAAEWERYSARMHAIGLGFVIFMVAFMITITAIAAH